MPHPLGGLLGIALGLEVRGEFVPKIVSSRRRPMPGEGPAPRARHGVAQHLGGLGCDHQGPARRMHARQQVARREICRFDDDRAHGLTVVIGKLATARANDEQIAESPDADPSGDLDRTQAKDDHGSTRIHPQLQRPRDVKHPVFGVGLRAFANNSRISQALAVDETQSRGVA